MSDTVTVALVGIAGYGIHYVNTILDEGEDKNIKCVAAVARRPERCERLEELKALGPEFYHDLDEFYARSAADLVIISSPIQLHCPFTCQALDHGSNVLCEKPVSATIQEAEEMLAKERSCEQFVSIGYQWGFANAVHALKKDIMAGALGAPRRMKCIVSWPRNARYYARNDWAGALKRDDGSWILDSPANNATAHYLFNMLYVLGETRETAAQPVEVQAELYRANPIQNFDTCALRCRTDHDVEVLFFTSHAVPSAFGPLFSYEFEEATVLFESGVNNRIMARFPDGTTRDYGNPNGDQTNKTWQSVQSVRTGEPVTCGIEASMQQTLCLNGAQESMPEIVQIPDELRDVDGEGEEAQTSIRGVQAAFIQCYNEALLPSEHGGIPWAQAGRKVDLRGYDRFPTTDRIGGTMQ